MGDLLDGSPVAGAVIGVRGVVDYVRDVPLHLPNLPRWVGHLATSNLAAALGVPLLVANNADLAALREHRFGAHQGVADVVYVTTSTTSAPV